MRQIITTTNIYKYNELSEDSKKNVWDMICNSNIIVENIYDMITTELEEDFPNSDADCQFNFSGTQGSGVNIYGKFSTEDLVNYCRDSFTDEEVEKILSLCPEYIELKENDRYTYSLWNLTYYSDILYSTENGWDDYTISNFVNILCDKMRNRCKEIKRYGEKMFDFDDSFASEMSEINDWEFYENGNLYRDF